VSDLFSRPPSPGLFVAAVAAAALSVPGTSAAVAFGAQAGVSTISPCPSFCGGPGRFSEFDIGGGPGLAIGQALVPAGVNGTGAAVAALAGGTLALPVLGADAFSEEDSRVSTEATAMHRYSYAGPTSSFTLSVTLEGLARDGLQAFDSRLVAYTDVVLASDLMFAVDVGTFRGEVVPLTPGASALATSTLDFRALGLIDQGFQSVTDTLNFTLENGDVFYVWASLEADGTRGGVAVGGNTFSMQFTAGNVAGLTASTAPVPVPTSVVLLTSALVGLAARTRGTAAVRGPRRGRQRPDATGGRERRPTRTPEAGVPETPSR